jgi:very-short-patch-repair endonuclease
MDSDAEGEAGLQIRGEVAGRINFACQQNDVPILRDLSLYNGTAEVLGDLRVEIASEPGFIKSRSWHVDHLGPGEQLHLDDRRVALDGGVLWQLSEAITATVTLRVVTGEAELARSEHDVELLARHEWGGVGSMPEMIAAFVTPNDPAVDRILKSASGHLEQFGLEAALDGYQSGSPQRAAYLLSAIWSGIGDLGLSYATPPASFEQAGQKIRTPSHIADGGLATCLDLTVLFASCVEQAGMHPVVVFTRGHSFVGCWLQDEQFAGVTVDDVTSLRKRLQLREALFFETTLVTQQPVPKFNAAIKQGSAALGEAHDGDFELAVDIRRARMQRIRPIPTGREPEPAKEKPAAEAGDAAGLDVEALSDIPEAGPAVEPDAAAAPAGRLDRWQRKLLDLSLRNRLLNFKPTKRSVTLRCPNPEQLEDKLADGHKIQIASSPAMMDEAGGRSAELHQRERNEDAEAAYATDALARNEVIADLAPQELDRRLVELYRAARSSLQENGANTLFLAFGFLSWRKGERKDEKTYRAPLILVPVTLERRSVQAGMRLVLHDDEPRVNPTLLQMLEQDFALRVPELSGPLPTDEHGLDVRGIWNAMTRAIRELGGWEVVEEVTLATFSFAKYLMWKDLVDRTDVLKDNPVVRHLIDNPKAVYGSEMAFPEPRRLDQDYPPEQTFTPLPADSSQLAAIMAAAQGKDFVLEGPPGTGKSQTIANMIAQCLAQDRTVLFVSEKTAALDVVYRRLRDVGLGEFGLELHSSKARKIDVLNQLGEAWQASGNLDAEHWQREAQRLAHLRERLNAFVRQLHQTYPNGLTPHWALGRVIAGRDVPKVDLGWASPEAHDRAAMQTFYDIADRIEVNASALGSIAESPFTGVATAEWSPTWQRQLIDGAKQALPAITQSTRRADAFERACSLSEIGRSKAALDALAELAAVLPRAHGHDYGFALNAEGPKLLERLQAALGRLEARHDATQQLSGDYRNNALDSLPVDQLKDKWAEAERKWWPVSAVRRRGVRKTLRQARRDPAQPNVANDLDVIAEIQRLDVELAGYADLADKTNGLWAGQATSIKQAKQAIKFVERLRSAVAGLADTPEAYVEAQAAVKRLLTDGNALLAKDATVGKAAAGFADAYGKMQEQLEQFASLAGSPITDLAAEEQADWPEALTKKLSRMIEQEPKLHEWCAWRRVRDEALANGLAPLVAAVESGTVASDRVREALEVNYCRWWIEAVVDRDEVLRNFVSREHEQAMAEFGRLDEQFTRLTRDYIRAKLAGQLPARDDVTRQSEWGTLKRELEKKSRHKPLRQLVEAMPTALTKLTPCLLMSPLSIAQYLAPDQAQFDVVIFDEASQIPVWDAVGAIARGKQTVVVGDPKQLPPTSFFERATDDDGDDEEVEQDLESILDECMGANLPVERLNWHYRSRNESLIAFSNQRYYGGGLVTFPAPVTEDHAVSFNHVPDGVYEKGGARTNQAEAKALVADVMARIKASPKPADAPSIGVVTFNTEQQRLVEDLFDQQRRDDPSIEPWFAEEAFEPVMVKNLESVQGDERDIIYFSVTFGPDQQGRVSMNFGPLNRDGGERRLNVAITRARQELRVFATLTPDHINLNRTQAVGVRDFKHFLEYAQRGPQALAEATDAAGGDFDSPFEQAVATALAERGWQIHPQVGVSGFRIDLGVVHPDKPGVYLAGIECDGATYHRAATARDRDKLREGVLRGLGWEILRVWSTDWWLDRAGGLEKLDTRLNQQLETSRQAPETPAPETDEPVSATETEGNPTPETEPIPEPATDEEGGTTPADDPEPTADTEREPLYATGPHSAIAEPTPADTDEESPDAESPVIRPYAVCDLDAFADAIDADAFHEPEYTDVLTRMVDAVIETEAPIRDELLVRRIARAHGFKRTGRRIRDRILTIAETQGYAADESVGRFYWHPDQSPKTWHSFRTPTTDETRSVEEIPAEELQALAAELQRDKCDHESTIHAVADYCGVKRLSSAIRKRIDGALHVTGARPGDDPHPTNPTTTETTTAPPQPPSAPAHDETREGAGDSRHQAPQLTRGEINKAINQYFEGKPNPLKSLIAERQSRYQDELEFLKSDFFERFTPSGDLKKALLAAVDGIVTDGRYIELLTSIGFCEPDGALTEAGTEKLITLLPSAVDQVRLFNHVFASDYQLQLEEYSGPLTERIEDHYWRTLTSADQFVVPESSNLLSLIGATFANVGLEQLCKARGRENVVGDKGLYLFHKFEENPVCFDIVPTDRSDMPAHLLKAWKDQVLECTAEFDWSWFEPHYLGMVNNTQWVFSRKYPAENHKREFAELKKIVSPEVIQRLFYQKFLGEIDVRGWPDLSIFRQDRARLVELKKDNDKLKLSQVQCMRNLLTWLGDVADVSVIAHRSKAGDQTPPD